MKIKETKIGIIGLGYVGLPLALAFSKKYPCIGFDINSIRVNELTKGIDKTKEASEEDLLISKIKFTTDYLILKQCNVFIITVPTPIDKFKKPDLRPLLTASQTVAALLKKGDVVIYESTVYPGCTEEDCVPILEKFSGLNFNHDFYCGYSPERINPGDKDNTLTKILKITSGSNPKVAHFVNQLYNSIITAGTYSANSIKIAEAAKLIENCQRDVNISFVNELALIFDRMGIDTTDVLKAAGTKWNFLPFKPGLVGGHCIGIDPYYMIHKAEQVGYYPAVIGAGRRINDNMGKFVANKAIKQMIKNGINVKKAKVLILGFTFKENCPDIRNTRVVDIFNELLDFDLKVDIFDPLTDSEEVKKEYKLNIISKIEDKYNCIILAVSHNEFLKIDLNLIKTPNAVVFDLKSILDLGKFNIRL